LCEPGARISVWCLILHEVFTRDMDSNAAFAKPITQSATHPRCAVCGMDPDGALSSIYKGKTYYFCMREHKQLFDASPEKFLHG